MQALEEAPPDMQCKDKFLLQTIVARPGSTTKDITSDMVQTTDNDHNIICPTLHILIVFLSHCMKFNKDSGYEVKEFKFRAVCVAPPPNLPSPVQASGSSDQVSFYFIF